MNEVFQFLGELLLQTLRTVGATLLHNWKILAFGILLAVTMKTYVNSEKLSRILMKRNKISILASVAFGAFTPLCACGTTAVIIGMMSTTLPWGPIMAFLTSSPLMSPDGFVLISGVISMKFAVELTIASVVIGIGSGLITNYIEKHTNFLANQSRFTGKTNAPSCSCSAKETEETVITEITGCGCGNKKEKPVRKLLKKYKLLEFAEGLYTLGFRQILVFYAVFVAVGYIINSFIPSSIITALFGAHSFFSVLLAAVIGLPLYITTDSGIPIIQSMLNNGAGEGAMLAFMITGSATSAWVIAGLSTFMKKRALGLYFLFVLLGGILSGYFVDLAGLLIGW